MPGREGELRIRRRHMWSVPAPITSLAASDSAAAVSPTGFSKDGRKICVGDCALFKPPQDSPPFIGIIRLFILGKEENLRLSVNWLYRAAEIKLGQDTLLEAAPNEVFYSFHRDEIAAASLLHPCKIAFLRKSVELPSGTSSFVCRRVYDTENKCLWWLTDKNCSDSCLTQERQEEVDQLLDKTQIEMYGAVQSGGRSPKPLTVPTETPQLRPGLESVQSISSLPSQIKGKKRDRGNQGSDPVKRERVSRVDDTDADQFRPEHILKSEIAKITAKGGLIDFGGVEKLVQLMQPGSAEKKIDLTCRIMLIDVLGVTDSFDCLGWFLQLRGLPVLDEWLQDVHKGKIGDGSRPKENEKSVEEFLLVLLRALDKLPVNLHALQTCNVGKSVNHLRSHKNAEIQKKARSLVDTWKKRVEAEMNVIDSKPGSSRGISWPSKSVLSEVSHMGNQHNGGSSGATQSSACVRLGSGEAAAKIASASTGSVKSAALANSSVDANRKELNSTTLVGGGSSDLPLSTIKEEKSSSSSQSLNNSQSSSSDNAKTGNSWKEEPRSSSAGSMSMNNISGGASRDWKSNNAPQESAVSGVQKETSLGNFSSLSRHIASERESPGDIYERVPDVPLMDHGNSQRLIVRLPNTGRSPRNANGGSIEDPPTTFKVSPAHSEKLDYHDRKLKGKSDALRASDASNINMDLGQGRDLLVRSNEGNADLGACNEWSQTAEDVEKLTKVSRGTASSSGVATKPGKSYDASFSSMNALVESCAKLSEASPTALCGDDMGMNLLASVAAGEVSRSDVSPSSSPWRKSPKQDSCSENDLISGHLDGNTAQREDLPGDGANHGARADQRNSIDLLVKKDLQRDVIPLSTNFSGDGKATSICCEEKTGSSIGFQQIAYRSYLRSDTKPGQVNDASVLVSSEDVSKEDKVEGEGANQLHVPTKSGSVWVPLKSLSATKHKEMSMFSDEDNTVDYADENFVESSAVMFLEKTTNLKVEKEGTVGPPSCSSYKMCKDDECSVHMVSDGILEEKPITARVHLDGVTDVPSVSVDVVCMKAEAEKATEMKAVSQTEQIVKQNIALTSSNLVQNEECGERLKIKVASSHCPDGPTPHEEPSSIPIHRTEQCMKSSGKLNGNESGGMGECSSTVNASSGPAAGSDTALKLDFDLNEGFPLDDGCQGDPVKSSAPGNSSTLYLRPLHLPVSSMSASFPGSITVASAAKGPFFPPENPSSTGRVGWKGSAATSAFRPAEPRKVLEVPLSTSDSPRYHNGRSKQGRPALDIDLNVTDNTILEDMVYQSSVQEICLESRPLDRHGGGLDLDLNRADECHDVGQFSVSNSCKFEIPQLTTRSSLPGVFPKLGLNASRDFDLNNGPGPDIGAYETTPRTKSNVPFLSPIPGARMSTPEQGNLPSWFPPSNSYSAIAISSILPASGAQRIMAPPGGTSFGPEFYRGAVLPSSPALPFSPAAPFQYAGFPFETNFPLPSNLYSGATTAYDSSSGRPICFPSIPSQLVGPSGAVTSHYPRPYVVNLPGGTSSGETRKWGGQALDLNTGPGGTTDIERRDDFSSTLRQRPGVGFQTSADEQIRMYPPMAGMAFRRKEPDGGWDGDRTTYKQPSWQ